jgi:hypothetical protein
MFPRRSASPNIQIKKYSRGILSPLNKPYKEQLDRELATRYLEMRKVKSLQRFEKDKIDRLKHNFDTRASISRELSDVLLTKPQREKLLSIMPEPSSSILYEKPEVPYLKDLVKINLYSLEGKQIPISQKNSSSPIRSSRITPIRLVHTDRSSRKNKDYEFCRNRIKRNRTPFFLTDGNI